jgi:uncharacterized protein YwgA
MNFELQLRIACLSAIVEIIRQMEVVRGRIRIQKILYFLKRLGVPELARVDFVYHHYGPFSWLAAESLADGVECGAIDENTLDKGEDRQGYEYRLRDLEGKVDELLPASRAVVGRLVARVRDEHWRTLELASAIDFLEQKEGLSEPAALGRALGLKPACGEWQEPALHLLRELQALTRGA